MCVFLEGDAMNVGAMKPSKFDLAYSNNMERCTAEEALAMIAKDKDVVKVVSDALAEHDSHKGRPGPTRTQAIRTALAEALQCD